MSTRVNQFANDDPRCIEPVDAARCEAFCSNPLHLTDAMNVGKARGQHPPARHTQGRMHADPGRGPELRQGNLARSASPANEARDLSRMLADCLARLAGGPCARGYPEGSANPALPAQGLKPCSPHKAHHPVLWKAALESNPGQDISPSFIRSILLQSLHYHLIQPRSPPSAVKSRSNLVPHAQRHIAGLGMLRIRKPDPLPVQGGTDHLRNL